MKKEEDIRLPAEWEKQDFILMVFPHKDSDWVSDLSSAESVFLRIASSISALGRLVLLCSDVEYVKSLFCYHERISFVKIETNDTWIRDFGPISVYRDNERELLDFNFNAWGEKFDFNLDNQVNNILDHKYFFLPSKLKSIDMVLEGGSIDTDGCGTLLTTTKCLLNPNRNPHLSKKKLEEKLSNLLGIKRFLWLEHGELIGDDTDAHIDTLARFVSRETIVYVSCEEDDEHFEELNLMKKELENFRTPDNEPYNLIPLPLPKSINKSGGRLAATYANFLITNKAVILPIYNDKNDDKMIKLFKKLFAGREIIPINSLRLIEEGGSIHCSTMNVISKSI
ncbi:MAG: agmatine deiminase family protein [Epsilonproteobacteria bacterium]|nr:agmatine deiminase family protein [Campylobacterota bacterium]